MRFIGMSILLILFVGCSHGIRKSQLNANYQVERVEATGLSPIIDNNVDLARKSAITDALKNALHLVVGVYLSADSLVSKSVLIDDEIKTNTQGYIERYEILKEYQEKGIYHVKIRADVRKEDIALKAKSFENEVERIGSPVISVRIEDNSQADFKGAENALIAEFKKDLFRLSYSTSTADVNVEGGVSTSFITSQGLGGFISYRCYIEGKISTSDGEPVGGFADSSSAIGLSDADARNNASVACSRKIYPVIKNAIMNFYLSKRTIKVEIEKVSSINDVSEIIKFFKNIPVVRNVYVKSYDNQRCVIDVVMHRGKTEEIYSVMNKSLLFDIKKISQFTIYAVKK